MIRKILTLSAAFLATILMLGLSAGTATASPTDVPGLTISQVGYNAVGNDREWNRNSEYVDVTNTSETDAVDVKGLVVADSWAHRRADDNDNNCNTWKIDALPAAGPGDAGTLMLPAKHTIRVYTGAGVPKAFGENGRFHAVYMNSRCGYHGHYLNNGGDTVWISRGADAESFTYDFDSGYYIR